MRTFVIALLIGLLTSCGYRSIGKYSGDEPLVLSIPLIWEDDDGRLRDYLAKRLSSTGHFEYASTNSRYQLIVKVERDASENIGYVWDQSPLTGARINRLYPGESQRTITARVHILDNVTEKKVVQPFKITVQSEFDFVNPTSLQNIQFTDSEGAVQSVLQFSLGQLDSEEGARTESNIPIYDLLAQKITEALVRIPISL